MLLPHRQKELQDMDVLIIDEISMVSNRLFDKAEYIIRWVPPCSPSPQHPSTLMAACPHVGSCPGGCEVIANPARAGWRPCAADDGHAQWQAGASHVCSPLHLVPTMPADGLGCMSHYTVCVLLCTALCTLQVLQGPRCVQ